MEAIIAPSSQLSALSSFHAVFLPVRRRRRCRSASTATSVLLSAVGDVLPPPPAVERTAEGAIHVGVDDCRVDVTLPAHRFACCRAPGDRPPPPATTLRLACAIDRVSASPGAPARGARCPLQVRKSFAVNSRPVDLTEILVHVSSDPMSCTCPFVVTYCNSSAARQLLHRPTICASLGSLSSMSWNLPTFL